MADEESPAKPSRGAFRKVVAFANPGSGERAAFDSLHAGLVKQLGADCVVNLVPRKGDDPQQCGPKACKAMLFREQLGGNDVVIVAGGDGTVCWGMNIVEDAFEGTPYGERPFVGVIPLGTGNDLSRALGFGPGYSEPGACGSRDPVGDAIRAAQSASRTVLDRWQVEVWEKKDGDLKPVDIKNCCCSNNYISIGFDAQIAQRFDTFRKQYPGLCQMRLMNKVWYAIMGVSALFGAPTISNHVRLRYRSDADSAELRELATRDLGIKTLILTNLDSFAAGMNPWTHPRAGERCANGDAALPSRVCDQRIEVCGFSSSNHMGLATVGCASSLRLCQAEEVVIDIPDGYNSAKNGMSGLKMQVDGEPVPLPKGGGRVRVAFQRTCRTLCADASTAAPARLVGGAGAAPAAAAAAGGHPFPQD